MEELCRLGRFDARPGVSTSATSLTSPTRFDALLSLQSSNYAPASYIPRSHPTSERPTDVYIPYPLSSTRHSSTTLFPPRIDPPSSSVPLESRISFSSVSSCGFSTTSLSSTTSLIAQSSGPLGPFFPDNHIPSLSLSRLLAVIRQAPSANRSGLEPPAEPLESRPNALHLPPSAGSLGSAMGGDP